jgi:hypothetical protein
MRGRYPLDIFSAENGNMKELLHRGTQADLNIYITTLNNGGIIGCAGPVAQPQWRTEYCPWAVVPRCSQPYDDDPIAALVAARCTRTGYYAC